MPAAQRLPCAARHKLSRLPETLRCICPRKRGSIATVRDSRRTFEVLQHSTTRMRALAVHCCTAIAIIGSCSIALSAGAHLHTLSYPQLAR